MPLSFKLTTVDWWCHSVWTGYCIHHSYDRRCSWCELNASSHSLAYIVEFRLFDRSIGRAPTPCSCVRKFSLPWPTNCSELSRHASMQLLVTRAVIKSVFCSLCTAECTSVCRAYQTQLLACLKVSSLYARLSRVSSVAQFHWQCAWQTKWTLKLVYHVIIVRPIDVDEASFKSTATLYRYEDVIVIDPRVS